LADDPCKQYLPDQSRWSHDEKLRRSKIAGHANQAYFDNLYTHINQQARDLSLPDARFLYALSSHESGWMNDENTWLNNPFGLTMGGADNLGFDSVAQSVQYWSCKYGGYVGGKTTMDQFVAGLRAARYNPNDAYYAHDKWASQIQSIDRWSARFGYRQVQQDGVIVLLPP